MPNGLRRREVSSSYVRQCVPFLEFRVIDFITFSDPKNYVHFLFHAFDDNDNGRINFDVSLFFEDSLDKGIRDGDVFIVSRRARGKAQMGFSYLRSEGAGLRHRGGLRSSYSCHV